MEYDKTLLKAFIQSHPADVARILESLPFGETASFLGELSPPLAAEVLTHLDPVTASLCLERLNVRQAVEITLKLPLNLVSLLLRRIEEQQRKAIQSKLPPHISKQISNFLRYGEGTAGTLMDPQVFTLPDDIAIKEALKRVQRDSVYLIHYVFVLNREQILVGFITIPQLMAARSTDPIRSIMSKPVGRLLPTMNRQAILANPGWHKVHALPVLDDNGVFLGAIGYCTLHQLERESREIRPPRQRDDITSAFGELYSSGLSACIKEMVLAVKGERTEPTS